MPEVLENAAAYFNPKEEKEMLTVIDKLLKDETSRDTLIALGKKQAKKYNWWECARLTFEIYQQILRKR